MLFSNTISSLETALKTSNIQQKVISNNIANADTPGFKAKQVSFHHVLQGEMEAIKAARTDARHFEFTNSSDAGPAISSKNSSYHPNGNSVDIDQEMSDLAKNQIQYNALVDRLNGKFKSLQTVLTGGR
ncbi:flagellar basal body rod protein FlgB [Bacillus sp. FJAT-42376]|uniref:flagellar basal body rod protein FlgB n=1 Tax=Bacillus sp. FJAT-42376 TaxID=2014076 RepID=UPI000F4E4AF9|nr:flagellar basal body rod protein FlgB [Bacillus sp. FJAT-42376]AZB42934.1 flagellar basal body rod protein FlgB [Bacillus sp. FJAT-42376]